VKGTAVVQAAHEVCETVESVHVQCTKCVSTRLLTVLEPEQAGHLLLPQLLLFASLRPQSMHPAR
jgi:hypothetical protein